MPLWLWFWMTDPSTAIAAMFRQRGPNPAGGQAAAPASAGANTGRAAPVRAATAAARWRQSLTAWTIVTVTGTTSGATMTRRMAIRKNISVDSFLRRGRVG